MRRDRKEDSGPGRRGCTRRAFSLGGAAILGLLGCGGRQQVILPRPRPAPPPRVRAASPGQMALIEVRGRPYELGQAIGRQTAGNIRVMLKDRGRWWTELRAFAAAQPDPVKKLEAVARSRAPEAFEELRGIADGARMSFADLLVLNLQAELGCLQEQRAAGEVSPGCSTIVFRTGQRAFIAHNEDGDQANLERMVLLKLRPEGSPAVLAACYPGLLAGNAPWASERGVVMTCNFIHGKRVRVDGVGRLFVHRQTMRAANLDEALRLAAHPERAYSYHCTLASALDHRVFSLEVTRDRVSREEAAGLYLHTNHLVHEALAAEPQDPDYVGTSSMSRWNALREWKSTVEDIEELGGSDLLAPLCSHQQRPYSPCRHPEGDVRGATVLCALVDLHARTMQIYKGQPCLGKVEELTI